MLKKFAAAAAVLVLAGASAQAAEFYDDLEIRGNRVNEVDGCAYVRALEGEFGGVFGAEPEVSGDSVVLSRNGTVLKMTAGSDEAELNGGRLALSDAPFKDEEGAAWLPAREVIAALGGHALYRDNMSSYNSMSAVYGDDVHAASGMIGDSFNNWTITLPDGFYYVTDSVDANRMYICDFDGIYVTVIMGDETNRGSGSDRLEDYLRRREAYHNDGSAGFYKDYLVSGEVYCAPTQEKRDKLNAVIDSFKPYFEDGAEDISCINSDGTAWHYNNKRLGIAFDIPLGWDTDDLSMQSLFTSPHIPYIRSMSAGHYYGSGLLMRGEVYPGIAAKEYIDDLGRRMEYAGTDAVTYVTDESVVPGEIVYCRSDGDGKTFIMDASDSTYVFSFAVRDSENEAYAAEMDEAIKRVFGTLKLSGSDVGKEDYEPVDFDAPWEDVDFYGLKFRMPSYLHYDQDKFGERNLVIDGAPVWKADAGILIITDYSSEAKTALGTDDAEVWEDARLGERTVERIDVLDYAAEGIDHKIWYDPELDIFISFVVSDMQNKDCQFIRDLKAILDSVH